MRWWEDPAVQAYIRKIADYRTNEEIMAEAATDDEAREYYEEAVSESADTLDELIIKARELIRD